MRVTYSPRAAADLREIAAYLKPRSPQGAARVRAAIRRTVGLLPGTPAIGTPQNIEGVRKLAVGKYPYLIFYRIASVEEVRIITILHAARDREYSDA
jgi:toxin ParE1/3/4